MVKGKSVPSHVTQAQRGGRGIAVPILPRRQKGWVVSVTPWPLYPNPRTCCTGSWVGLGAGFERQTLNPVASRYTDYPIKGTA